MAEAALNWAAATTEYVTGTESYSQLGERYGVSKGTVEKHALDREANGGRTWGEMRTAFRLKASAKAERRAGDALADRLGRVRDKAAETAELALDEMLKRIRAGGSLRKVIKDGIEVPGLEVLEPIADKDLIAGAKLATTIKVEFGGDPEGVPVEIRQTLGGLDVETLRKLAE